MFIERESTDTVSDFGPHFTAERGESVADFLFLHKIVLVRREGVKDECMCVSLYCGALYE